MKYGRLLKFLITKIWKRDMWESKEILRKLPSAKEMSISAINVAIYMFHNSASLAMQVCQISRTKYVLAAFS